MALPNPPAKKNKKTENTQARQHPHLPNREERKLPRHLHHSVALVNVALASVINY
jgi:hypothetical protein